MKSLPFAKKLDLRLHNTIEEDFDTLIDAASSSNVFNSREELHKHLAEGSLLNISKIASKALSVPCGEYVVWITGSGHTMLVPTDAPRNNSEVYEDKGTSYDVLTRDLLSHWNKVEKVLAEAEEYSKSSDDPNFETNQPETGGEEEDEDEHGGFTSHIHMSTVDRSPIVRAMEQHGHTVTSLANAVGVQPPAISRILRTPKNRQGDPGGRNPSIGLAAQIANELKMDSEALFPDIFGTPKQELKARKPPGNRGSGMSQAAHGSTKKGQASKKWSQGNK